ncbi:hypothetical protein SCUCBS95973_000022 [Sporothrix curviconia]|uniref:Chromosome segregation protein n=1 Tax=Sporothrix curviconia TaxID=1260050 RepID=A0ABP0AK35_9PEZI
MSSSKSTPSPQQRPANQVEEAQLPAGHCRYILLLPEIKGQRCGCAHFNLNRSLPGATCECGHLSCYHVSTGEPLSTSENQELVMMRQRLDILEQERVELRQNVALLQQRVSQQHVGQDHDRDREAIVRVSQLEDMVEKIRSESKNDVREAYQNLGRAWDSITDLMHSKKMAENHLRHINERLQDLDSKVAHIGERQLELVDMDISLEGRIEDLEELGDRVEALEDIVKPDQEDNDSGSHMPNKNNNASSSRRTVRASPPPLELNHTTGDRQSRPRSRSPSPAFLLGPETPRAVKAPAHTLEAPDATPAERSAVAAAVSTPTRTQANNHNRASPPIQTRTSTQSARASVPPAVVAVRAAARSIQASSDELWTVHVSLMPTPTQPFPFERDTNAYKRCLSRGLHQMVAVSGTSAEAFEKAIDKAFGRILRGRKWTPLQALPCTAETLAGLPMIRPLDASLIDERCDLEFLRNHCAVCNTNGKIDSLYIAMRDKTLSWHSIRRLPIYLEGLEPCWGFDMLLDANDPFVDEEHENDVNSSEDEIMGGMPRPSAGDIVATLPSLKRAASEMSRSSSFGSATVPAAAAAPTSAAMAAPATATAAAAEGEGSRPKVPRIYPLPNIVEVRRGVKTS